MPDELTWAVSMYFFFICTEIPAGIYEFLYTCGKGGSIEYLNIKVCLLPCILFPPSYMCQIHGTFWQSAFFRLGNTAFLLSCLFSCKIFIGTNLAYPSTKSTFCLGKHFS